MEQNNLKKQITLGVLFIIIGICFLSKDFVTEKREKVFSKMNLELTDLLANSNEEPQEEPQQEEKTEQPEEAPVVVQKQPPNYEPYVGILEIPKIGFSKGFYKKESSLNNVKFNLKILPQSNYPDEDKGNVIIIGHSGNYNNSYFANLYQLAENDTASIKYNNITYTYKIVNIYTDKKDGTLTIYRDETKNCLTLITCTKDDETSQTIYILELVSAQ